jgi:SHS2 domain-containing protein
VLEEAIFILDAHDLVPVQTQLWQTGDGAVMGEFETVPVAAVRISGPVPKAVTLHRLRLTQHRDVWRCNVTIDV